MSFTIKPRQMAIINDEGKCILEPGTFRVIVGGSQPDKRSEILTGNEIEFVDFEVIGQVTQLKY